MWNEARLFYLNWWQVAVIKWTWKKYAINNNNLLSIFSEMQILKYILHIDWNISPIFS
jgi:hypothetical protein